MKEKYFQEAGNNHYYSRYYRGDLPSIERRKILINILRSFISTCERLQAKAILIHGGLIGWYWNQQLLPWDDDIDVCMSVSDFQLIATDSNLIEERARYMLDINPHHESRKTRNRDINDEAELNKIDARFIDITNGLYIDITILIETAKDMLATKCPHYYHTDDIIPLIPTQFEGIPIYVPNNPEQVLIREYGRECTQNLVYGNWFFDPRLNVWIETTVSTSE